MHSFSLPRAIIGCVLLLLFNGTVVRAQSILQQPFMDPDGPRVQVGGFGVVNYFNFKWDTDPSRRPAIDIERFEIGAALRLTPIIEIRAEVEFEHGGTGVTMEYDPFEEFGEFEMEVEKGGEIELEELNATFKLQPGLRIRAGLFYIPIAFLSSKYLPSEYLTVTRNDVETTILPAQWSEVGVKVMGRTGVLRYQGGIANGLDNSAFSSANWIRPGKQNRFETLRVANFAFFGRVDLLPTPGLVAGVSGYAGNSTGNRPKPDLDVPAWVTVVDGHVDYTRGRWRARGVVIYGHLQNSAAVSEANRRLSNNLNVKRTPVGSEALGWYAEAGYNVLPFIAHTDSINGRPRHQLIPFAACQFYDSMYETAPGIFDNPRWERKQWIAGLNYYVHPQLILKAQYAWRTVGLATDNHENTFAAGIGAEF